MANKFLKHPALFPVLLAGIFTLSYYALASHPLNLPAYDGTASLTDQKCIRSGGTKDCSFYQQINDMLDYQAYEMNVQGGFSMDENGSDVRVDACILYNVPMWSSNSQCTMFFDYQGLTSGFTYDRNISIDSNDLSDYNLGGINVRVKDIPDSSHNLYVKGRRVHISQLQPSSTSVTAGQTITVSWNTQNVTGNVELFCSGPGFPSPCYYGNVGTNGFKDFTPTSAGTANFTLKAWGPGHNGLIFVEEDISVSVASLPTCSPSNQSVQTGVNANLSASGGTGSYSWSASGGNPSSGSGSSFSTSYSSVGTKTVTVTSGSNSNNCTINVFSPGQYGLSVNRGGSGGGTVIGPGINCGSDCSENYNSGTSVTLDASPDGGSTFDHWEGDCSGTNSSCALTMNSNKSVTAYFQGAPGAPEADIRCNGNGTSCSIASGESAQIEWCGSGGGRHVCNNATSCEVRRLSDNALFGNTTSGDQNTGPLTSSMSGRLICNGPGGSSSDDISINVGAGPALTCTGPANVQVNNNATFTASGGSGAFSWSITSGASGCSPTTDNDSQFDTTCSTTGSRTVTVTRGGSSSNCVVSVDPIVSGTGDISVSSNNSVTWCISGPFSTCETSPLPGKNYNNVPAGSYTITPENVSGYNVTVSPNSTQTLNNGSNISFSLNYSLPGEETGPIVALRGYVVRDSNGNLRKDAGESELDGVRIILRKSSQRWCGNPVYATEMTTGSLAEGQGYYYFGSLYENTYYRAEIDTSTINSAYVLAPGESTAVCVGPGGDGTIPQPNSPWGEDFAVVDAPPPTLRIEPVSQSIQVGDLAGFKAYFDPDGSGPQPGQNITNSVSSWSSINPSIASYQNTVNQTAYFRGNSAGSVGIGAWYGTGASAILNVIPSPTVSNTTVEVNNSIYCNIGVHATVSGTYTDPGGNSMTAYEIQIDDDSDPLSGNPEWESGVISVSIPNNGIFSNSASNCNVSNPDASPQLACQMTWNTIYRAWARVRNSLGSWSQWILMSIYCNSGSCGPATSWQTARHEFPRFPEPVFNSSPSSPSVNSPVRFTDATIFDPASVGRGWSWTFTGGNPSSRNNQGPHSITYSAAGSHAATLIASDDVGSCTVTKTINVQRSIPRWREVAPR